MEYTHYWKTKKLFSDTEISTIVGLVQKLINNLPAYSESSGAHYSNYPLEITLTDALPYEEPLINMYAIIFNGYSKCAEWGLSNEHFIYPLKEMQKYGNYCRTARKPYDFVVQAILLIMQNTAPKKFVITSTGNRSEWEWTRKTASKILGIELSIPNTIIDYDEGEDSIGIDELNIISIVGNIHF